MIATGMTTVPSSQAAFARRRPQRKNGAPDPASGVGRKAAGPFVLSRTGGHSPYAAEPATAGLGPAPQSAAAAGPIRLSHPAGTVRA